jgi:hypothetical protein
MRNKTNRYTVGAVPKPNKLMVERGYTDTASTQMAAHFLGLVQARKYKVVGLNYISTRQ